MTPTEQLRVFIERVKGEHRVDPVWITDPAVCECGAAVWPCDALRAVLALEEMTSDLEQGVLEGALARAAQKIGGKGWSA